MPMQIPLMFLDATRDSKTGTIYAKVATRASTPQSVHLALSGVTSDEPSGTAVTMSGSGHNDTHSITDPTHIVPVTAKVDGLSTNFTHTFPPYSINVPELNVK